MSSRAPRRAFLLAIVACLVVAACSDDSIDIVYPPSPNLGWWDGFDRQGMDDYVYALAEYDDAVVAGGLFQYAGGVLSNSIARWDGSTWAPLGAGILRDDCPSSTCHGWVQALTLFEGDLVAGGRFTQAGDVPALNVARWNGTRWDSLGSGLEGTVYALAVYRGVLVAGGSFIYGPSRFPLYLATWDGSTWGLGVGTTQGPVRALLARDDTLYVGGDLGFDHIAAWGGNGWVQMGDGLNETVSALAWYRDELVAAGDFDASGDYPNGITLRSVGIWNGMSWRSVGSGVLPSVSAVAVYHGNLLVAGALTQYESGEVGHVARWDGTRWSTLGAGLDRTVSALLVHDDHLYFGGGFRNAGHKLSRYIARWDD